VLALGGKELPRAGLAGGERVDMFFGQKKLPKSAKIIAESWRSGGWEKIDIREKLGRPHHFCFEFAEN